MCGIAGVYQFDGTGVQALASSLMFATLMARGKDAAGYVYRAYKPPNKYWCYYHKDAKLSVDVAHHLYKDLDTQKVRWVLEHSRSGTKGDPKDNENNHPLFFGHVAAIHNGVIWNDDELFKSWNVKRIGKVDSMAVPAALSLGGLPKLLEEVKGSMAIAWVSVDHPNTMHLYTNGRNPIWVWSSGRCVVFASEEQYIPVTMMVGKGTGRLLKAGDHYIITPKGIREEKDGTGNTLETRPVPEHHGGYQRGSFALPGFEAYKELAQPGATYLCLDPECPEWKDGPSSHHHDYPNFPKGEHHHWFPSLEEVVAWGD